MALYVPIIAWRQIIVLCHVKFYNTVIAGVDANLSGRKLLPADSNS